MIFLWGLVYLTIGLLSVLYLFWKWQETYFSRRGVKTIPGYVPFAGHMLDVLLKKAHFKDATEMSYWHYPNEKYVGLYQFLKPMIVIRDLELIKKIGIKDFDHFPDHSESSDKLADPLMKNNLFTMTGQKWRDMRATLSPAFTSSKMKGMFDFVMQCGKQMTDYYLKELEKPENKDGGVIDVEMKDAFTKYTNDVIASSAFGLEVNSMKDGSNQFYLMSKVITSIFSERLVRLFMVMSAPWLMQLFNITLIPVGVQKYFNSLILDSMKEREEKGIHRPDMIHLLMAAKKGTLKHEGGEDESGFATAEESSVGKMDVKKKWTDDELIAQAFVFLLAGFDSSSSLMCFLAHELALNQNVQRKLQEEIDTINGHNGGILSYQDLQKMKYLDCVVSETLRLWPFVSVDRSCVKTYVLPPPNAQSNSNYTLKPGDGVRIPIYAIQRDPTYFINPDFFDPERFSDENKSKIVPGSYIPFGVGPRNCIGSRFALMETKAIIYHMLLHFDFVRIPKTQDPIVLSKKTVTLEARDGFWIGLRLRNV